MIVSKKRRTRLFQGDSLLVPRKMKEKSHQELQRARYWAEGFRKTCVNAITLELSSAKLKLRATFHPSHKKTIFLFISAVDALPSQTLLLLCFFSVQKNSAAAKPDYTVENVVEGQKQFAKPESKPGHTLLAARLRMCLCQSSFSRVSASISQGARVLRLHRRPTCVRLPCLSSARCCLYRRAA